MIETDTEVLYLARGEQEILVEKCPKKQAIIDGLRFLYRQYVKKKPGVILNEPERCMNIIQTVLFINSMRPLLERPTLLLCDEGVEQKWLDHFLTWTEMANDVTADTINPFTKKVSVYITPVTEMGKFYSRDWSIVIVDSDIIHREILRDKLNARFKIWITCVNIKENLNIFSQLHKWLYPKQTFDANVFESNKEDPHDAFSREIKLESFMEEIVLKRNNNCVNNNTMSSSTPPRKVTRKNKDATGTKIKRTKRKNRILSSEENSPNKLSKPANVSNYYIEQNSFNVGEEISNISISKNLSTNVSGTTINSSKTQIEYEDDINSEDDQRNANREMSKSQNDSSIEIENIEVENSQIDNNEMTKAQNEITRHFTLENHLKHNDEISIKNNSYIEPGSFKAENVQIDKNSSIESDENNSYNLLLQFDEESTPLIIDETKSNDSDYNKDTQANEFENIQYFNAINSNINDIEHKITNAKTNLNEIDTNEVQSKIVDERLQLESENLFSTESISNLNKTKDELNKINKKDELIKVENVENNKTDSNIDTSSVEYKMKQIEELAMKKFKGSFLDSLF